MDAEERRKILAPLEAEFDGRIKAFDAGKHGLFVVRHAKGKEYRTFKKRQYEFSREKNHEGESMLDEQLALACVIWPTDDQKARAIIEDYPLIASSAAIAIIQLSSAAEVPLGKE